MTQPIEKQAVIRILKGTGEPVDEYQCRMCATEFYFSTGYEDEWPKFCPMCGVRARRIHDETTTTIPNSS